MSFEKLWIEEGCEDLGTRDRGLGSRGEELGSRCEGLGTRGGHSSAGA